MGEQIPPNEPSSTSLPEPTPTPLQPTPDPLPESINADARTIYNYHRMNLPLFPPSSTPTTTTGTTAIFTLCSLDTRVAHRAASLFLSGLAPPTSPSSPTTPPTYSHLIFSGNIGALTAGRFAAPEAEVFASIAASPPYNIPREHIIVEPRSTNTGENVRFTYELLKGRGLLEGRGRIGRFVLVQKPYMERRTYATFVRQWPAKDGGGEGVEFTVTSPELEWEEYPDGENPRGLVVSIMVGDLVRIREYPKKGFQIEQEIPGEVWEAGERLVAAGFGGHLP